MRMSSVPRSRPSGSIMVFPFESEGNVDDDAAARNVIDARRSAQLFAVGYRCRLSALGPAHAAGRVCGLPARPSPMFDKIPWGGGPPRAEPQFEGEVLVASV